MLLDGKNAIIYGGGGSIGGAVARAFAREGAKVHLAGRTPEKLEAVADEIRANGAQVETAQVDALDPDQVDAHVDVVAAKDGRLDVSFCLISQGDVQGTPLNEMSVDDFMQPVVQTVRATFVTSRAAARHMIRQRSGVILAFGGYGPPMAQARRPSGRIRRVASRPLTPGRGAARAPSHLHRWPSVPRAPTGRAGGSDLAATVHSCIRGSRTLPRGVRRVHRSGEPHRSPRSDRPLRAHVRWLASRSAVDRSPVRGATAARDRARL